MHSRTVLHLIDTGGPGGAETIFCELVLRLPPDRWQSVAVIPNRDWLEHALGRAGVDPIVLPTEGPFDVRYLSRLYQLMRSRQVDLVQTHLATTAVYASMAALPLRIPQVSTFHGVADLLTAGVLRQVKSWIISRKRNRAVFVSESLRKAFALKFRPFQASVIHNGIDVDRYGSHPGRTVRAELGLPSDYPLLGAIGNIRPAKDYPTLLRSVALLAAQGIPFRLVVAGQPDRVIYPQLLQLRDALELRDRVHFLGFREDVRSVLAGLDVYLLSSISEGFSLSTVQAMAAGKPVIVTRSGGPEEIVQNDVTGVLVPPRDPKALADATLEILRNPQKKTRLAQAGRDAAFRRYDVAAMVAAYERVYSEALGLGRSSR